MICDLYSLMDQETVKQYARRQNDIIESLNNIIEQCDEFEEKLSEFRVETVKRIKQNNISYERQNLYFLLFLIVFVSFWGFDAGCAIKVRFG